MSQRGPNSNGLSLIEEDNDIVVKLILQRLSTVSSSTPSGGSFGFSNEGADERALLQSLQNLLPLKLAEDEATLIWEKVELLANRLPAFALELFPLLLTTIPSKLDRALELVRNGLVSDDTKSVTGSCRAIWRWLSLTSEIKSLPKLPDSVLVEIAEGLQRRRVPALIPSLELARWLVKEGPIEKRNLVVPAVEAALAALLGEATYGGALAKRQDVDICDLREKCASVAAVLTRHLESSSEATQNWIYVATEDPMPEVRHAISNEGSRENPLSL